MKTLIYFQNEDALKNSGIGRAMSHQLKALNYAGVEAVVDPKGEYDIAHINTYFGKSQRLLKKAKKQGIPVIVHGHSTFEDFRNSFKIWQLIEPYYDGCLKKMYKGADMIIAPTPYARDLIKSYGFCQNVIAVSNGINMEDYKQDEAAQAKFRETFGIQEGEKFVMGVGFPFERKGLIDFIEVARRFPDIKFFWFGYLQRILTNEKIIRAIKKKPDNVIMAGYQKGDIIHGAYQLATCLFFPSFEETEGIVVLEALASRCPLVVRDIGVYEGWVKDGYDGHLCKNNDEFAAAIQELLDHGEKKEILDNGYQVAADRDLSKIGDQLKAAYEKLLLEKKGN
jgi:1,2-diacylglycerol-3-alpha-glucose alpha-1,2-glucosyltransferase